MWQSMKSLEEIKDVLARHKDEIRQKYGVKEIGIFGSYVKGEEKPGSDLDVLVEFSKPIGFFKFLELEEYLEKLVGVEVDLVSKKALKPRIGEYIKKEVIAI